MVNIIYSNKEIVNLNLGIFSNINIIEQNKKITKKLLPRGRRRHGYTARHLLFPPVFICTFRLAIAGKVVNKALAFYLACNFLYTCVYKLRARFVLVFVKESAL